MIIPLCIHTLCDPSDWNTNTVRARQYVFNKLYCSRRCATHISASCLSITLLLPSLLRAELQLQLPLCALIAPYRLEKIKTCIVVAKCFANSAFLCDALFNKVIKNALFKLHCRSLRTYPLPILHAGEKFTSLSLLLYSPCVGECVCALKTKLFGFTDRPFIKKRSRVFSFAACASMLSRCVWLIALWKKGPPIQKLVCKNVHGVKYYS